MTYLFNNKREDLLRFLPENAVVAEIGVANGDFSAQILEQSNPKRLYLIDPWAHQGDDDYQEDPNNVSQVEADKRCEAVQCRFSSEIERGQIVIIRELATVASQQFTNNYFDWVYIDAMHTYQAVSDDLHKYWPKIKPGGILLGHDYANNEGSRQMKFGVVSAVNDFFDEVSCEFTALTLEPFPTYVLSKDTTSEDYLNFSIHALRHLDVVAKINNLTQKNMNRPLPSFQMAARAFSRSLIECWVRKKVLWLIFKDQNLEQWKN